MKRIRRDPVRFDVFAALAHHSFQHGLSIRHNGTVTGFVNAVRDTTLGSLSNDAFVFGFRTQAMFETVIASLGKVQLLKQEDAGAGYYGGDADLAVPDHRIVLNNGTQLLVEVKNFHQAGGTDFYVEEFEYLRRLDAYATMTRSELLIAVYWSGWNIWTLVPSAAFTVDGKKATLELEAAFKQNQMSRIGDQMIGTRWPLRIRLEVEELGNRGAERQLLIRDTLLYSEDRILTDPVTKRLAMFLMLNGGWHEDTVLIHAESKLTAIEFHYAPEEQARTQAEQGFDIVGSMSSMISRFFREATVVEDEVARLQVDFTPGEFGQLVPEDYDFKGHGLPLWQFTQGSPE